MQGVPNSWGKGGDLDSSWALLLLSLLQYWGHRAVKDLGSWANWRPRPPQATPLLQCGSLRQRQLLSAKLWVMVYISSSQPVGPAFFWEATGRGSLRQVAGVSYLGYPGYQACHSEKVRTATEFGRDFLYCLE